MEELNPPSVNPAPTSSFAALNAKLEQLVQQLGCPMTLELLEALLTNRDLDTADPTKLSRMQEFLMTHSVLVFDLRVEKFFTHRGQEYHDARMACQYLMRKHTQCSHAMIGELWQTSKRMVIYACNKYDEMLSIPSYYQELLEKLNQLEIALLQFLTQLK